MDSYTFVKTNIKYVKITNEVLIMKIQDPNWERLLIENFDFSSKSLKNAIGQSVKWMRSWLHTENVTNTPLHRKKDTHEKHE